MIPYKLNVFGDGARFHHIGLVVPSIAAVCPEAKRYQDPTQKVGIAFVEMNGSVVELLEPDGPDSPVLASLKNNVKLVHFCFEVPALEAAINHSRQFGFHCLRRPVPAVAFDQRRIAWLFSKTYGLVELVEETRRSV
jgi:methylmalonyl-CoA/ethylmalonyl-CoA epimerase